MQVGVLRNWCHFQALRKATEYNRTLNRRNRIVVLVILRENGGAIQVEDSEKESDDSGYLVVFCRVVYF